MTKGFRKIFWGTLLVSFLSTGGGISLIFVLIGWGILISGLGEIGENPLFGGFKRLEKIAIVTAAVSLGGVVLYDTLLTRFPPITYYPVLVMTAELILFHGIFAESVHYFNGMDDVETANKYTEKDRNFMVLVGIALVFLSVFYTFNEFVTGFIGISATIISKIYLLSSLHSLSRETHDKEIREEEQSFTV
jgi:hypothetical protein